MCRWKPIWNDLQDKIEAAFNRGEITVLNRLGADGVEVFLQYDFEKMEQVNSLVVLFFRVWNFHTLSLIPNYTFASRNECRTDL